MKKLLWCFIFAIPYINASDNKKPHPNTQAPTQQRPKPGSDYDSMQNQFNQIGTIKEKTTKPNPQK